MSTWVPLLRRTEQPYLPLLSRLESCFALRQVTCGLFFWLFAPTVVLAGHGFVTAFGNIEWLPEPGRTPDSAWYILDAWQEEGQLWLARTPEAKLQLCLTFAREKLAEVEAMVRAENTPAAETAAGRYQVYIDRAKQLALGTKITTRETVAEAMANALLEHQYILSIIYEELPANARAVVPQVISVAQEQYEDITQLLSPKKKGALFFKEEEVRWSVQMATRADEDTP